MFKEHGLVPPVEIAEVDLGFPAFGKFPSIKLRDWVQYLLDSGLLWRHMTGCSIFQKMQTVPKEFWNRMKHLKPGLGIFDLAERDILDLECAIPVYSHTDEGRSLKKQPIFILSTQGLLGRGTHAYLRSQRQKAPLHRNAMGMNVISHPMATHFIFACFLKAISDKAKHWVASGLVLVVEFLDIPDDFASSVDKKFEWLNTTYQQFCREHGRCGWVKHIDKDLLNFPSSTVCPFGSWNKGSTSTHLMKFLEWFSVRYTEGKTNNEIPHSS